MSKKCYFTLGTSITFNLIQDNIILTFEREKTLLDLKHIFTTKSMKFTTQNIVFNTILDNLLFCLFSATMTRNCNLEG